ncbi:glycosyltransferase family 4 protein [Aequorivita sp. F47161]|uniref:Glycosyltransferase family 4 protein n=1 Tax=Aequorivita vitellina TaxID=2874475 RepID=A0A9X1QYU9_9FLAO|nr:glycosyltransferase family 4 protein [Aequorivita vitellina]MCG2419877.1 glycosyltransferase family 4 protein [Aequorivita vitellina]
MNFNNKNILLIIHSGGLGGAERQGLSLGKVLTEKHGCNVYLLLTFSRETSEEFEQYARACHIKEIFFFGEPYIILRRELTYKNLKRLVWSSKYLWRLRTGLMPYKFDFIFPFLNFPSKVAFYLYKLLPSVKFTFWHQLGLDTFKFDIFEKHAAKNIPCVIANAPSGIELFYNAHLKSKRPSFVLPQFLAFEVIFKNRKNLLRKYGIPENAIVIGMVAHYRPEKLHYLLLNVFKELLKEHSNIYMIFLGNKNNSTVTKKTFESLQENVITNQLTEKIKLISEQPVTEVLSILDIGVLVSEIEGTPNAVMEYMAYGLPVVATNHSGCKLLLKNEDFLIENSMESLKNKLNKLIISEELRKGEGEVNRKLIRAYTPENYLRELLLIVKQFV